MENRKRGKEVENRKPVLQPVAQRKRWASMTLTFVGNVGAVMQVKTGPNPDTGVGGPFHN